MRTRGQKATSDIVLKLEARLEAVGRKMAGISGEPCGGVKCGTPHDCTNPRHTEWFLLSEERERLRGMLARARRLPVRTAGCSGEW